MTRVKSAVNPIFRPVLDIEDGDVPVVLPPRRVPVALNPLLKDELRKLQDLEIIAPITEPTPWVLV